MILCSDFLSKFTGRIARRVHLSSESPFSFPKSGRQLREADAADDHQVDVAERVFIAAGHRAVEKGAVDIRLKSCQDFLKRRENADRFLDQAAYVREQR